MTIFYYNFLCNLTTIILVGISWNLHRWAIIGASSYTDMDLQSFLQLELYITISSKETNSNFKYTGGYWCINIVLRKLTLALTLSTITLSDVIDN